MSGSLAALAAVAVVACQAGGIPSKGARLAAMVRTPDHGKGRHPAVVLVHGSGRVTAQQLLSRTTADRLTAMGFVVLAYDKRGVGESTGEYSNIGPHNSVAMFELLATDALAAVDALRARDDVDPARIGLIGFSQGGWISPLAASMGSTVAFVVSVSGPAVSVGEEIAYSEIAGEDPGSVKGLTDEEIDRRMASFRGPHGYDPGPVLARLRVPSLWILGERDHSIPIKRTVAILSSLKAQGRPITTYVIADANHGLMRSNGERTDFWPVVQEWLRANGKLVSR
jgi:dienelactone hydrolase